MTAALIPVRRNLSFHLPHHRISNWNAGGTHWTHFLNTLSVFFPAGERFFIQSVRHYRDRISDPQLKQAVAAFIGQEAFHTREHEDYNQAMTEAGLHADQMEKAVEELLALAQARLPRPLQLAVTVSLEHLTAMMAELVLTDEYFFKGSDPRFHALWQWHAMEETEHKGVAYDVYEQAVGTGPVAYAMRTGTFLAANLVFWTLFYRYYVKVLNADGELLNLRGWLTSLNYQFGPQGLLSRMVPEWLDFFRPGFHPWDKDNRHHLNRAEALMKQVESFAVEAGLAAA